MFREVLGKSIATADYSPTEIAAGSRTKDDKGAIDRGFCVRPSGSGPVTMYGITWNAYYQNGKSLTDLTPVPLYSIGSVWEMVPLIKVYAANDGTYPSGVNTVNVGVL